MFLSRDRTSIRHEDVNKQSAVLFDRYAIQLLCCQLRKSTNECVQQTFLSFSVEYEQAGKTEGLDWQRSTQALGAERRNSNMQWSLHNRSVASIPPSSSGANPPYLPSPFSLRPFFIFHFTSYLCYRAIFYPPLSLGPVWMPGSEKDICRSSCSAGSTFIWFFICFRTSWSWGTEWNWRHCGSRQLKYSYWGTLSQLCS